MGVSREIATAFVEGYGRAWENWDFDAFVDLFSDDVATPRSLQRLGRVADTPLGDARATR